MQITFKDLLVTVLPKAVLDPELAKVCLLRTVICRNPTLYCFRGSLGCDLRVSFCGHCSFLGTCGFCSVQGTGGCGFMHSCGPGNSACDPTNICPGGSRDPFIIQHLEDLVSLKAELQATIKSLDAIQKEGLPSAISTKAEAEAMERGLTEALEQVRAAKKNL